MMGIKSGRSVLADISISSDIEPSPCCNLQSATRPPYPRRKRIRIPQFNLPMAGLEPARAFYGPTDFKSVASAISPHRRHVWCSLNSFFSGENEYRNQSDRFRHAQRSLELADTNLVKR